MWERFRRAARMHWTEAGLDFPPFATLSVIQSGVDSRGLAFIGKSRICTHFLLKFSLTKLLSTSFIYQTSTRHEEKVIR